MSRVPYPDSLYQWRQEWVDQCAAEGPYDARHLGRRLTFLFNCERCGPQCVTYEPDYPYCGPNSNETCPHCYRPMPLVQTKPIDGEMRPVAWGEMPIRRST